MTVVERVSVLVALALALIGVLSIVRSRRGAPMSRHLPGGPVFLWLIPIVLIAVALPVAGLPRYRAPADPFILLLAALGTVAIWDRLRSAERGTRRRAGVAGLATVGAILLAGCGTAPEPSPRPQAPPDPDLIERIDAACASAHERTAAIGRRMLAGPETGGSLEFITEQLVAPAIPLRARLARRIRHEVAGQEPNGALADYIALFDPIGELMHQRLEAGRRGDVAESKRLEDLIFPLGNEQANAARNAGLDFCARDFVETALGAEGG